MAEPDELITFPNLTIEKFVLILSLITLILVIYYLAKTYFKHDNILEKFSEKILYKDVKFRDCEIYFTNDKEGCDRDYAANNKDTCKYKFENWKELDKIGDGAIKKHKVYVDNKLNEGDYANVKEETRCFYKLGEDDDKSGDNIIIIDNNYYTYNDKVNEIESNENIKYNSDTSPSLSDDEKSKRIDIARSRAKERLGAMGLDSDNFNL